MTDFSGIGSLDRNFVGDINRNANHIKTAGQAGQAVLFADLPQFSASQVKTFVERGPLIRVPTEGVFQRLIFATKDGTVVVDVNGVVVK